MSTSNFNALNISVDIVLKWGIFLTVFLFNHMNHFYSCRRELAGFCGSGQTIIKLHNSQEVGGRGPDLRPCAARGGCPNQLMAITFIRIYGANIIV